MSRRVPEFAVITGVFLGVAVVVSGLVLGWGLSATVALAVLASYPFIGFGIVRDDDPAATLPPRWLLIGGSIVAAAGAVGVVLDDPTPGSALAAVLVALAIGAPAAAYATRYGADVNPLSPRATVLGGLASGVILVVWGLAAGRPLTGLAAGGVAGIGSALYGTERGVDIESRTKQRVAAAGGVVGVAIVGIGVVRGDPLREWLLVGIAVAAIPSLYAALTAESRTKRYRTRR